jgi:NAD(P)-dependent dehydrogenase (short-subunit alcohol dehydrogenase family)
VKTNIPTEIPEPALPGFDPSLQDRPAVVVTGVSSGIGLTIAEDLLSRGYRVFGSVRHLKDAEGLIAQWPAAFIPLVFDLTDTGQLKNVVQQVRVALAGQGLTALVNNAGISHSGPLMHQTLEEIRKIFEVNVFGLIAITQAFLPLLGARRDSGHPPGRVVNIGSVSGGVTVPFMGAYSASKHAVDALSQGLRRELRPFGIEVSTIEPGFIRSKMFDKAAPAKAIDSYADTTYAEPWQQFNRSLLEQERNAKSPEIVARAVLHAIEAPTPRTRYPLDPLWRLGWLLPDRAFDRLIFKALGIAGHMTPPK